jgi:serine/threonine-protein kinase
VKQPDPALAATKPETRAGDPTSASSAKALGRYTLRELLGAGGMGEVWSAHDPGLDRVVAIKLVRSDLANARTRARLAREAQALARVNHPNVVAVHEVGADGDQVYFVQELVRGVDLARWLEAAPRTRREVVDVFVQAGRGLAAAHDAGIVHRDFKPSNVLVGDDGRTRVGDFGLARTHRNDDDAEPAVSPTPKSDGVTETGAVVGTPLYMSPEQHLGHAPNAAGDQFSFCVSLYQALFRQLPFAGKTPLDYSLEAVRGEVCAPPRDSDVPAWLRELLLRGLRSGGRTPYASMHELVDELAADHASKRRWRWAVAGAALVAASAGAVVFTIVRSREEVCSGAPEQLATVWNDGAKAAARDAFAATHLPYAPAEWLRVQTALDSYGRAWTTMHTDTCKATRMRGEQSEAVLDLRMSCLAHRLQELDAAATLFGKADAQTVEKAQHVAAALAPVAECADVDALRAVTPSPRDPVVAAKVDAIHVRLASERALVHAGKYKEALPLATALVADARATDYAPVLSDASMELGRLQAELRLDQAAELTMREAFLAAQASGLDANAVRAAGGYAQLIGGDKVQVEEARWWLELARSTLRRRPDRTLESWLTTKAAAVLISAARYDDARAELERGLAIAVNAEVAADQFHDLSIVLQHQGKYEEALAAERKALAERQRVLGPDHPAIAIDRAQIASLLGNIGHYDQAIIETRAALAVNERALGVDHPFALGNRFVIATLMSARGDDREALGEYRRVLEGQQRRLAATDPAIAATHRAIGITLGRLERFDEAIAELGITLALDAKSRDVDDPSMADTRLQLGMTYSKAHRLDEALRELGSALDIYERKLPSHPIVAVVHSELADVLGQRHRFELALDHARRGLAITEKAFGTDHPYVGIARKAIGFVLERWGKYNAALVEFRRALPLLGKQEGGEPAVAEAHMHIGVTLSKLGKHREALQEITTALAGYEKATGPHSSDAANARAELGRALIEAGDYGRAADLLTRAADELAHDQDHALLAAVHFQLARARWEQGNDRAAARALAVEARDVLAKTPDPDSFEEFAEVKKWLASH